MVKKKAKKKEGGTRLGRGPFRISFPLALTAPVLAAYCSCLVADVYPQVSRCLYSAPGGVVGAVVAAELSAALFRAGALACGETQLPKVLWPSGGSLDSREARLAIFGLQKTLAKASEPMKTL